MYVMAFVDMIANTLSIDREGYYCSLSATKRSSHGKTPPSNSAKHQKYTTSDSSSLRPAFFTSSCEVDEEQKKAKATM